MGWMACSILKYSHILIKIICMQNHWQHTGFMNPHSPITTVNCVHNRHTIYVDRSGWRIVSHWSETQGRPIGRWKSCRSTPWRLRKWHCCRSKPCQCSAATAARQSHPQRWPGGGARWPKTSNSHVRVLPQVLYLTDSGWFEPISSVVVYQAKVTVPRSQSIRTQIKSGIGGLQYCHLDFDWLCKIFVLEIKP